MGSSSIVAGQKRPREHEDIVEDADLDDRRYTPRRRTQDHEPQTPERESRTAKAELLEQLDRLSPPPTPTPGRADKGKGRMTAEQVETLEMERTMERERFLEEIAPKYLWPGPVARRVNLSEVHEQQGASTSKQGAQANPKPLWLGMGDPTYVSEPFMELPTSNIHPHNGVPHLRLGTSPAFSSASQQPRPTRRSTRKRVA